MGSILHFPKRKIPDQAKFYTLDLKANFAANQQPSKGSLNTLKPLIEEKQVGNYFITPASRV